MLPNTFREPKSVCVSSCDVGPRSWDLGFGETLEWGPVVQRVFACLEMGEVR